MKARLRFGDIYFAAALYFSGESASLLITQFSRWEWLWAPGDLLFSVLFYSRYRDRVMARQLKAALHSDDMDKVEEVLRQWIPGYPRRGSDEE